MKSLASDRSPRLSPNGQQLAFVSRRSGHPEIWLAEQDGSRPRALTALQGLISEPAWQPSGEHLAFRGHCGPGKRRGLCVVAVSGGAPRALAADAATYGRPTWHPTRPEVWVSSDRGGRWQLWRFALDGSAATPEPTGEPPGRALQWLADGRSFVYQPQGARHLLWRRLDAPGAERRLDLALAGEEFLDWRLQGRQLVGLMRGEHESWRRLSLDGGRLELLGEHALGSFPERASFDVWGNRGVLIEVADTEVADMMLAR